MATNLSQAFMAIQEVIKVKPVRWQTLTDLAFIKEYQIDFNDIVTGRTESHARFIYTSDRCEVRVPRRHPIDSSNLYRIREIICFAGGVSRSDRVMAALREILEQESMELVLPEASK